VEVVSRDSGRLDLEMAVLHGLDTRAVAVVAVGRGR
jgi:hypothetical protein